MVSYFIYLGQTLTAVDNNWPSVVNNLQEALTVWSHLSRILEREGGDVSKLGNFYLAVFQATILFGS